MELSEQQLFDETKRYQRCQDDNCRMYTWIKTMMMIAQGTCYPPVDRDRMRQRRVDPTITSFFDFEDVFLGGHFCNMESLKKNRIKDKKIQEKMKRSFDVLNTTPYYAFCSTVLFRTLFPVFRIPDENDKVMLMSWKEAEMKNALSEYFSGHDIFRLFGEVKQSNFDISYADDYIPYILENYSRENIFRMYRTFLATTPGEFPLYEKEYPDIVGFTRHFEKQLSQYIEIFSQLKEKEILRIVGDGPGTASIAAFLVGRDYTSDEPGTIGSLARQLGIINYDKHRDDHQGIYCFF